MHDILPLGVRIRQTPPATSRLRETTALMTKTSDVGVVVLDTNAIGRLAEPEYRARAQRGLRAVNLEIRPSFANLMELASNRNANHRTRRLTVVAELMRSGGLLPGPQDLLRQVGVALVRGVRFVPTLYGFEEVFLTPGTLTPEWVERVRINQLKQKERWNKAYDQIRADVQAELREKKLLDKWTSIPDFLEREWMRPERAGLLMKSMRDGLGLPATLGWDVLSRNETWRLFLEGLGANHYEQCILRDRTKPAHPADIAQLLYLSVGRPRILVTRDGGLCRVASAILDRRYARSRVMHPNDFFPSNH